MIMKRIVYYALCFFVVAALIISRMPETQEDSEIEVFEIYESKSAPYEQSDALAFGASAGSIDFVLEDDVKITFGSTEDFTIGNDSSTELVFGTAGDYIDIADIFFNN